jgi:hypothetical protein
MKLFHIRNLKINEKNAARGGNFARKNFKG